MRDSGASGSSSNGRYDGSGFGSPVSSSEPAHRGPARWSLVDANSSLSSSPKSSGYSSSPFATPASGGVPAHLHTPRLSASPSKRAAKSRTSAQKPGRLYRHEISDHPLEISAIEIEYKQLTLHIEFNAGLDAHGNLPEALSAFEKTVRRVNGEQKFCKQDQGRTTFIYRRKRCARVMPTLLNYLEQYIRLYGDKSNYLQEKVISTLVKFRDKYLAYYLNMAPPHSFVYANELRVIKRLRVPSREKIFLVQRDGREYVYKALQEKSGSSEIEAFFGRCLNEVTDRIVAATVVYDQEHKLPVGVMTPYVREFHKLSDRQDRYKILEILQTKIFEVFLCRYFLIGDVDCNPSNIMMVSGQALGIDVAMGAIPLTAKYLGYQDGKRLPAVDVNGRIVQDPAKSRRPVKMAGINLAVIDNFWDLTGPLFWPNSHKEFIGSIYHCQFDRDRNVKNVKYDLLLKILGTPDKHWVMHARQNIRSPKKQEEFARYVADRVFLLQTVLINSPEFIVFIQKKYAALYAAHEEDASYIAALDLCYFLSYFPTIGGFFAELQSARRKRPESIGEFLESLIDLCGPPQKSELCEYVASALSSQDVLPPLVLKMLELFQVKLPSMAMGSTGSKTVDEKSNPVRDEILWHPVSLILVNEGLPVISELIYVQEFVDRLTLTFDIKKSETDQLNKYVTLLGQISESLRHMVPRFKEPQGFIRVAEAAEEKIRHMTDSGLWAAYHNLAVEHYLLNYSISDIVKFISDSERKLYEKKKDLPNYTPEQVSNYCKALHKLITLINAFKSYMALRHAGCELKMFRNVEQGFFPNGEEIKRVLNQKEYHVFLESCGGVTIGYCSKMGKYIRKSFENTRSLSITLVKLLFDSCSQDQANYQKALRLVENKVELLPGRILPDKALCRVERECDDLKSAIFIYILKKIDLSSQLPEAISFSQHLKVSYVVALFKPYLNIIFMQHNFSGLDSAMQEPINVRMFQFFNVLLKSCVTQSDVTNFVQYANLLVLGQSLEVIENEIRIITSGDHQGSAPLGMFKQPRRVFKEQQQFLLQESRLVHFKELYSQDLNDLMVNTLIDDLCNLYDLKAVYKKSDDQFAVATILQQHILRYEKALLVKIRQVIDSYSASLRLPLAVVQVVPSQSVRFSNDIVTNREGYQLLKSSNQYLIGYQDQEGYKRTNVKKGTDLYNYIAGQKIFKKGKKVVKDRQLIYLIEQVLSGKGFTLSEGYKSAAINVIYLLHYIQKLFPYRDSGLYKTVRDIFRDFGGKNYYYTIFLRVMKRYIETFPWEVGNQFVPQKCESGHLPSCVGFQYHHLLEFMQRSVEVFANERDARKCSSDVVTGLHYHLIIKKNGDMLIGFLNFEKKYEQLALEVGSQVHKAIKAIEPKVGISRHFSLMAIVERVIKQVGGIYFKSLPDVFNDIEQLGIGASDSGANTKRADTTKQFYRLFAPAESRTKDDGLILRRLSQRFGLPFPGDFKQ